MKREELARVQEHLGASGLTPGLARELRKHVAELERQIADWMDGQAACKLL